MPCPARQEGVKPECSIQPCTIHGAPGLQPTGMSQKGERRISGK